MKKGFIFFLIMALFLSFSNSLFAQSNSIATMSVVKGDVKLLRGTSGTWCQVKVNTPLYSGDKIKTGKTGLGAITYIDGSQVKINNNTTLELVMKTEKKKSFVNLLIGEIWLLISPQKEKFEVKTPAAVAGVEGTEFDVKVNELGEAVLTVIKGTVSFENSFGAVKVKDSMQSSAKVGEAPLEVKKVDAKKITEWNKNVSSLTSVYTSYLNYYSTLQEKKEAEEYIKKHPKDNKSILMEGKLLFDKGDTDKSKEKVEEFIKLEKNNGEGYGALGKLYRYKGDYDMALKMVEKAIELSPDNPIYYIYKCSIYDELGLTSKAKALYEEIIKKFPKEGLIYNNFGLFYWNRGQFEKGENYIIKAIKLAPKRYEFRNNLGNFYHALGKYEKAIKEFKKSIEINSQNIEAYNGLGLCCKELDKIDEAKKYFEEGLKIEPKNSFLLNNFGNLYTGIDVTIAIDYFEKALKVAPDNMKVEILYNLGKAYNMSGYWELAAEMFEHAKLIEPHNGFIHIAEGEIYMFRTGSQMITSEPSEEQKMMVKKAIACFKEAAKDEWTEDSAFSHMIDSCLTIRDYSELLSYLTDGIEHNPKWSKGYNLLGQAYNYIGENCTDREKYYMQQSIDYKDAADYHKENGQSDKVEDELKRAEESDKLAKEEKQKARDAYEKSVENFQKALELSPEMTEAHIDLANLYLQQFNELDKAVGELKKVVKLGEGDRAVELLNYIISVNPKNSDFHYALGKVYEEMGNKKDAEEEFKRSEELKK